MSRRAEDLDGLLRIAALLIPGDEIAPAASDVLADETLLDRALAARPDLLERLNAAVALGRDAASLAELELSVGYPSAEFDALTLIVAGAYYMSPKVLETLDYDPPTERYVVGNLEDSILRMIPDVTCRPRRVPES